MPTAIINNGKPKADGFASENGALERTITTLEMHHPPDCPPPLYQMQPLTVIEAKQCTVSFYRYLYDAVGDKWLWYDRRYLSNAQLKAIISDPQVTVWVLYVEGVPAGYAELDGRRQNEIELAYFGLIPEFIGRRLGQPFVDWAVHKAWQANPKRVWLHTCNHDHPAALSVYRRAGFTPCRQATHWVRAPRAMSD